MLLQVFLKDDKCVMTINTDRLIFHELELYAELLNPTRDKTGKKNKTLPQYLWKSFQDPQVISASSSEICAS